MGKPPIVSPQEWEAAREELLVKEKELTRARDALTAERSDDGSGEITTGRCGALGTSAVLAASNQE